MDTVARDFCDRVSAVRCCCKAINASGCKCKTPPLESTKWNFRVKREKLLLSFKITFVDGRWKYCFVDCISFPSTYYSIDELRKTQNLKEFRVSKLTFENTGAHNSMFTVDNMETLLNFVTYLSNEPLLDILLNEFGALEGSKVLEWLEGEMFSSIWIKNYLPILDQLLRNQLSRREYPRVIIHDCDKWDNQLADHLKSGNLKRLAMDRHVFSTDVIEGIIQSFMSRPRESSSKFNINVRFDPDSTQAMLHKMEKKGLCTLMRERCRKMGCCGGGRDQMYVSPHFSENHPRYRVWCGMMHITTYSGFVAFWVLIRTAAVFATSWLFTQLDRNAYPEAEQIATGFFAYGVITILILMLYAFGLFSQSAYSTVPFVTLMIFETAILTFFCGFAVYWFYIGTRFAEIDNFVKVLLQALKESGFNANVAVRSLSEPIHAAIVFVLVVGVYIYMEICRILICTTLFFVDVYRYNQKRAGTMIYGTAPRLGECAYSIDG